MGLKVGLDPVTEQKLRDFARRRYRLIVLRGICSAVVSLLAILTVIAILDWLWVLPDTVRWTLSLSGYGLCAVIVWITSLRLMAQVPNQRQLARLVESTEPSLREDLISAVELGAREDANLDSPVFRQLLQQSVADRMRGIQITHLLPWRMVMGWTAATLAILMVCAVLASPLFDFPFVRLLERAAFPGANLARVSDVSVQIVEPRPLSPTVPQGDPVSVVAEVNHPDAAMLQKIGPVIIETDHPTEGRRRFNMVERTSRQYGTNVLIGREPLRYRIHAGDAVTEWNTIGSRPRPQVATFQKTLTYPPYSQLDVQTIREKDGNLKALEGTEVELILELDQPATGRLELDLGEKKPVIELQEAGPNRLRAQLPIQASGTYKVLLVSTETGFQNTFSPNHEITALPDLVPRVEITQPRQNLLAPPDEIVALRGAAEDDLALASVEQWVRVNDGKWQQLPLVADIGSQTPIAVTWDLVGLRLKTGDRVTTKLVATDLKGSRGESAPLQITVSASGFEAQRQAVLNSKLQVLAALDRFAGTAEQALKDGREAMSRIDENPDNFLQVKLYASNLAEAVDRLTSESDRSHEQLLQVLRTVPAGLDAQDLVLLGNAMAALRHGSLQLASTEVAAAASDLESTRRRERLDMARQQLEKVRNESKRLVSQFERLVGGEILTVATHSLTALHLEQQRLKEQAPLAGEDPAVSLRRIARSQSVTSGQMRLVEQTLGYFEQRFDNGLARHLDHVSGQLAERRQILEQVLADALPSEHSDLPTGPQLGVWHAVGPFRSDNYDKAFQQVHDPEKFIDLTKTYGSDQMKWEAHPEWTDAQPHVLRGENSAFYLFRTITVNREQEMDLSLGSDDGIRLLLNGKRLVSNNAQRAVAADQERVKLKLKPGQNNLLMKIVNGDSDGGFYFRAEGVSVPEAVQKLGSPLERIDAVRKQVAEKLEWALRELKQAQRDQLDREKSVRRELSRSGDTIVKSLEQLVRELAENAADLKRDRMLGWRWPAMIEQLKTGSSLEEARIDADARFVADNGNAARTLQILLERYRVSVEPDAKAVSQRIDELTKAYNQLQVVHEVRELAEEGKFLNEEERWKHRSVGASVNHPILWRHLREQMPESSQDIRRASLPNEAAELLGQIPGKPHTQQMHQEMERRMHELGRTNPIHEPVLLVSRDLQQVLNLLEEAAEKARQKLQELAPTLPEMMRALAMKAQALSDQTEAAADKTAEKQARDNRSAIQELAKNQQEITQPLNDILDALRQDAGLQDPLTEQGRQRARDDDDSSAMLRDPNQKAEEALAEAARSRETPDQTRNLNTAADQQEKLAETLQKLADHFERMNKGEDVADSRQMLREAEEALGIRETLDQEYAKLEQLADLAQQQDPNQLLAALEQELDRNRAMQRELDALTQDAVDQAKEKLDQAANREDQVAQQLQQSAQQQNQQNTQQQLQQLQKGLEHLAKDSVPKTSEQAKQAGAEEAAKPIQQAQQQADQALNQSQTSPDAAPQETAQKLAQLAQPLNQAADQLDQAAKAAQKPSPAQQQAQQNSQQAQQQAQKAGAENQQAQQQAQKTQQAAQQAAQQAEQKAQSAQQAAENAKNTQTAAQQAQQQASQQPDNAELKQAAENAQAASKQAQAKAREAAQQAQSAQQSAQKAAAENQSAQAAAQKAQQQSQSAQKAADQAAQQSQSAQQAAQATAQKAQQAAAEARQLANQAQQLAQQLAQAQAQGQQALTQAAGDQQPVAQQVGDASETLARAARHEDRLGNEPASNALEQSAQSTGALAQDQLPQAAQQISSAATPQAAQPTAQAAAAAIREQSQALGAAESAASQPSGSEGESSSSPSSPSSSPASGSPSASSGSPFAGQSAEQLARALDMADRQVNSPGGTPASAPPGASPASPASSPLASAAAAQAASMRQARSTGLTPGQSPVSEGLAQKSEQGATIDGPQGIANVNLPDAAAKNGAEWGKLPPKMAKDLLEGRRESVSGPYRSSVETYFRVLADQAREQKGR